MATDRGALRVIYLEDREIEFRDYSERLKRVLRPLGSTIQFEWVKTAEELKTGALSRPHVVLCDNEIEKNSNVGLKVISELKQKYPDCLFCLLTSHLIRVENLGAYVPNPELIISKQHVGTEEYDQVLREIFETRLKRAPIEKLEYKFDLKKHSPRHGGKKQLTSGELVSLVEQCVDTGGETEETGVSSIQLSVVNGGASGSGVYEMRVLRDDRVAKVPAILKISDRVSAIEEYRNYIQFVKWRLPYTWRVDVLGTGFTGDFGAICYSFAAGGGGSPTPVNTFIRRGEFSVIDKVIDTILDSKNQTWYAEDRETEKDARDYFASLKFYRSNKQREEFQAKFLEYIADNAKASMISMYQEDELVILDGIKFPRINKLLFSNDWGRIRECVCHGDMNGGNVIYAGGDSSVVFIDFQRTGYWYLFRDFISFESSTRLEFPTNEAVKGELSWWDRLRELIALEDQLYDQAWSCTQLPEYGSYVCKIRQAAHLNFESEPFELYVFANVVHSLWLFQKAATWGREKQLRLAAAVLAGSRFLWKRSGRCHLA